jgi:hypothetical protein
VSGGVSGEGGEATALGGARDAGPEVADAASDAEPAAARPDASEGGAAGAAGATDGGDTGGAAPHDAGPPAPDCATGDELPQASDAGMATCAQVQDVLNTRCVTCHSGANPPKGLVLTDVSAIVGTQSVECSTKLRIDPGSAKNSYLVDKLRGASQAPCGCFSGQRMPLDADPLEDTELAAVVGWINAGARQ